MVRSGNSEHVRFRYGMCLNENCSKCKSKEVQTISARKDFVCAECGKQLRECPPPTGNKNKLILIIVAVLVVVAGVILGITQFSPKKPSTGIPPTETPGKADKDSIAAPAPMEPKDTTVKTKPETQDPPTGKPLKYGTVDLGYGIYTGDLKNGTPHGHGTIKYTTRHKIVSSQEFVANPGDEFEGEFRDGRINGGIGYWTHDGNITAVKP